MSSSVHFRLERFLAKGRRWATSIAGRLACGAFETRFCEALLSISMRCSLSSATYPEGRNNDPDHFLLRGTLGNIDEKGYNVKPPVSNVSTVS